MVTFDPGKCNGCGLCARVCHEHCITVSGSLVSIDECVCSTCGQCIAICASRALAWNGAAPVPFDETKLPSAEQIAELLGERRTVRRFKPEKIDRRLLEEIVGFGALAPTHNFDFRAIVIDDEALLQALDASVLRFSRRVYRWVFGNPVVGMLASLRGQAMKAEFARARPKLEHSLKLERAYASLPPAVILIVGAKSAPLSLESAQYAVYNINLYAMTKGLACRNLVGNQMILNRDKTLRRRLGLSRKEKIFATLGVGYGAVRFRNKVIGKTLPLAWNGRQSGG